MKERGNDIHSKGFYLPVPCNFLRINYLPPCRKNIISTLFECQCIQHESTNLRHFFGVSYYRRDRHFTWSTEGSSRLQGNLKKAVPSYLSISEYWSGQRDRTSDLPLCSQALYRLSYSCRVRLVSIVRSKPATIPPQTPAKFRSKLFYTVYSKIQQ